MLITLLLLGAAAGLLAGLLGVGGGLVIVPVLALLFADHNFAHAMHLAIGTSLATIIFTSISSVYAHHRRGAVLWQQFRRLTPGIVVGALIGSVIADLMAGDSLRLVFAIFELSVAAQMGFGLRPDAHRGIPGSGAMSTAGGLIGSVSAVVGIGGGTMTVPFLVWYNVKMQQAVATAAAVGLPIAVGGTAGFAWRGWGEVGLPEYSLGYIYLPALLGVVLTSVLFAPLGARIAHALPGVLLKRVFALFLTGLGLRMLFGALS